MELETLAFLLMALRRETQPGRLRIIEAILSDYCAYCGKAKETPQCPTCGNIMSFVKK